MALDLLRCPLDVRVQTLAVGASGPSAPFDTGDGVGVVYNVVTDGGGESVFRRMNRDGSLTAPQSLGPIAAPSAAPLLLARPGVLVQPFANGSRVGLRAFDLPSGVGRADAPATPLPGWPVQLTSGPRGIVMVYAPTRAQHTVVRGIEGDAQPDVTLGAPPFQFDPPEQLLASGAQADVLLSLRRAASDSVALDVVSLAPGAAEPSGRFEIARASNGVESSVAASASGFLVAFSAPSFERLSLLRLDASGARASTPEPLRSATPGGVLRYPRITPLDDGWALSYWDGTGPVVQRLNADGSPAGAPIAVRSGDERGGQTEARMAVVGDALAITWTVREPMMNHGLARERPEHPGPRLALLRCRRAP